MKLKSFGLAVSAVLATMAIGATTASATTLETNGVKNTSAVEIKASLESGTSTIWEKTDGSFGNTCIEASMTGKDSTATTGTAVSGPVSLWRFNSCTNEGVVVDAQGSFSIENISGTTNGTVKSSGTEITVPTPFGLVFCKTGSGVDIGTFTGKASGSATLDIKAIFNCGILASSMTWEGSFTVTSGPNGITP